MYFNPLTNSFTTQEEGLFKLSDYQKKVENTGKNIELPMPPVDGKGKSLGELPSRLITGVLDIGTTELNTNLTAGSMINCVFPKITRDDVKESDDELAGL